MKKLFITLILAMCASGLVAQNALVTFQVNMYNEIIEGNFDPANDQVTLAGGNFWPNCGPIFTDPDGDAIYTATDTFTVGNQVTFNYYIYTDVGPIVPGTTPCDFSNGFFESDTAFANCGTGVSGNNRVFTVPAANDTLPVVCFSQCGNCPLPSKVVVTYQVNMYNEIIDGNFNPATDGVTMAGGGLWPNCGPVFSDPDGDAIYTANDTVPPGSGLNYNYYVFTSPGPIVPGVSPCDFSTGFFESDTAFANCGSGVQGNNRRHVAATGVATDTVPVVCFSQCGDCPLPSKVVVTHQVNMYNEIIDGNFDPNNDALVMAGGSLWPNCGSVLTDPDGDAIYTANDTLNPGSAFNFSYYVYTASGPVVPGTSLCNFTTGFFEADTAFANCSSGVQGNNRRYVTPFGVAVDTADVVCFSQCGDCPAPSKVVVTFQVNMNNEIFTGNFDPANDVVAMAGANFWPNCGPLMSDPDGDGIYTRNDTLNPGASFDFSYYVYNAGGTVTPGVSLCNFTTGFFESDTAFANCASGVSGNNRSYTTPNGVVIDSTDAVCFGACGTCDAPAISIVTYQVDMSNEIISGAFNPTSDLLAVAGGIFWPNCGLSMGDLDGDSIYTALDTVPQGSTLNYNYYIFNGAGPIVPGTSICDGTTGFFESDSSFANCATAFGSTRTYTVSMAMDSIPAVCFSQCASCPTLSSSGPSIPVTFQVNMRNEMFLGNFNPTTDLLALAGGSFDPNCGPVLTDADGDSIYTYTDILQVGSVVSYKYFVYTSGGPITPGTTVCDLTTGFFESSANFINCTSGTQGQDRVYTVPGGIVADVIPLVCFSQCGNCTAISSPNNQVTFKVDMSEYPGNFTNVNINGNFNGFCGGCNTLQDPDGDMIYEITLDITTDSIIYLYTIDGFAATESFSGGESCTRTVVSPQGASTYRAINNITQNIVLDPVCWNSCKECFNLITFRVDMSKYQDPFNSVNLSADFNGFCTNCALLTDPDGDKIYEIDIELSVDSAQYLFSLDNGSKIESLQVGSACTRTTTTPTGVFTNRYLFSTTDKILPASCWSFCETCDAVSIDPELTNRFFTIHPNRVQDAFKVDFGGATLNASNQLDVIDATGKLVYRSRIAPGTQAETINVRSWAKGIYLVRFSNNEQFQIQKVLVE